MAYLIAVMLFVSIISKIVNSELILFLLVIAFAH